MYDVCQVRTVSRVYHSACLEGGQSYWDYDNFQLSSVDWETPDRYEVTRRLGYGRFSEVRGLCGLMMENIGVSCYEPKFRDIFFTIPSTCSGNGALEKTCKSHPRQPYIALAQSSVLRTVD